MSNKKQTIPVQLIEEKRNINGTQVFVTKLLIGKNLIGFIIPEEKHFYTEINSKREVNVKSINEGIEYLIAKHNLQQ